MITLLSLLSIAIAWACYSISQLQIHDKLKWSKNTHDYWGRESDDMKYKEPRQKAPDNFYYRYIADMEYVERFPGASSIFVMFTDGYHLMQFFCKFFLSIAIALQSPWPFWISAGAYIVLSVVFSIVRFKLKKR
ncbi:MAG: hypothetical protein QM762_12540 [Chryseolinea sp.]